MTFEDIGRMCWERQNLALWPPLMQIRGFIDLNSEGIVSPTACYSLDFSPLWCNKFKVLPHWATVEHIDIPFGALQSFGKGSQSAKELLCVRGSAVYSSWVDPLRPPRRCAQSLSHIFLRHDSFIYMLWKAGRAARWRHPRALLWVWKFPSLHQHFLTLPVMMAARSGGSRWAIGSKFAAFQRCDSFVGNNQGKGGSSLISQILPRIIL